MNGKTVEKSKTVMIEPVLPEHTNIYGNLFGGKLTEWIDKAGSIVASRHCRMNVVTASLDNLHFLAPIKLGDVVILNAWLNYVGHSSMEIQVYSEAEDRITGIRKKACVAYLTYVAIDSDNKPTPVPPLILTNDEEKERFESAKKRKEQRLETLKEIKKELKL